MQILLSFFCAHIVMMNIFIVRKEMCTQPYHFTSVHCIGWEKTLAIDFRLDISSVLFFHYKKITQFCCTSSLSSHRRVIYRGNSSCGFCLCILSVTSRVSMNKRTTLRSFSFPHSFSCQTFISYIYIYIYILIERCWYRQRENEDARVYIRIFFFDKYCTTIDLFLGYYIMDKLYWWTYIYIHQESTSLKQTYWSWLQLGKKEDWRRKKW
jgi:hypothetical protein